MRWLLVLLGAAILAAVAAVIVRAAQRRTPQEGQPAGQRAADPHPEPTPKVSEFTDPCGTFETKEKAPVRGHRLLDHPRPPTTAPGGSSCERHPRGRRRHGDQDRLGPAVPRPRRRGPVQTQGRPARPALQGRAWRTARAAATRPNATCGRPTPKNRVCRMYVYRTDESFGPGLFRCPQMEHKITVGKRVYFRILAPMDGGSDDSTCDFTKAAGRTT